MKRFLIASLLALVCSIQGLSSDIAVSSTTVSNWTGGTTGIELRGFLSSTLTVPSGTPLAFTANSTTDLLTIPGHSIVVGNALYLSIGTAGVLPTGLSEGVRYYAISVSGNDVGISTTAGGAAINFTTNGSGTIYVLTATTSYPASSPTTGVTQWRFACTVSSAVVGGITVYTLTIPAITIPATTNAVSGYGARWSFHFYNRLGARISIWSGYENLRIPTSAVSTSWDAIKIYNNDTVATADTTTYTKTEIDALLIACCSGGGGGSGYSRMQEEGVDLTQRTTLNFVGGGFTAADDATRTTLTLDADLSAIAALSTSGFAARTGSNTWAVRTITSRGTQIGVSFGAGTSADPYLYLPDTVRIGEDGTEGRLEISGPADTYAVAIQANPSTNYTLNLPTTLPASTQCLQLSVTGQLSTSGAACGSGSGGAPSNARYLLTQADATLTDERILQTTSGLTETDLGAGANFEIGLDLTYAAIWTGKHTHTVGTNTTSVESMLISKANRTTDGQTDSDYLTWYGKGRDASVNYTAEWRAMVDVVVNDGQSEFVLKNRINTGTLGIPLRIGGAGDFYVTGAITSGSGPTQITDSVGKLRPEAFDATDLSGNNFKLVTTTGTLTSGRCVEIDASGNFIQSAGACSGGSAPAGSTLDYQINNAGAFGAGNLKDIAGGMVSITNGAGAGGSIRAQAYTQTQITADTNNLTAGGRSFNLYLSTDAARSVRGLTFSGFTQIDGELHLLQNTGTFPLLLTNEDASATAANRFHTASGRTVTLLGDRAALTVWDDTIDRHRVFPLAVNAPEILHVNSTIPVVNNTTTETSLLTATFSTPANFFTVGRTLHVRIAGIMNTAVSAPTLRIRLFADATVLVDSTAITTTSLSGTARSFTADVYVLCTSVGATGAFDGSGQWRYNTTANALASLELVNQVATANTTGSLTWDIKAQWGTANAQNTISITSVVATAY